MKRTRTLVGIVVGVAAGFIIGRFTSAESELAPPVAREVGAVGERKNPRREKHLESRAPTVDSAGRSAVERLREIVALTQSSRRAFEAETLIESLPVAELPGVLVEIEGLPPGMARWQLLQTLFQRWGELDFGGAMEAAKGLPERDRMQVEHSALLGWAKRDRWGAWASAKEEMAGANPRGFRAAEVLGELAKSDLPGAIDEWIAFKRVYDRSDGRQAIMNTVFEAGGIEELLKETERIPSGDEREGWVKDIFMRWGAFDSDAPLAALRAIGDPALARSAMAGMVTGWAQQDPVGAVAYVLENRGDALASADLRSIVMTALTIGGESETREIAAKVVKTGAFESVADEVILPLSSSNPRLALELAGTSANKDQREARISNVLSNWASRDLPAAVAYYGQMPAGELKSRALPHLAMQALRSDEGVAAFDSLFNGLSEKDRVRSVQTMVYFATGNLGRPRPGAAAAVVRLVAKTPGLPERVLEQARKLTDPPPSVPKP